MGWETAWILESVLNISFENTFLKMKVWRPLSARYFKNIHFFVSAFHVRSLSLWLLDFGDSR
jgi:hypothetical protein